MNGRRFLARIGWNLHGTGVELSEGRPILGRWSQMKHPTDITN